MALEILSRWRAGDRLQRPSVGLLKGSKPIDAFRHKRRGKCPAPITSAPLGIDHCVQWVSGIPAFAHDLADGVLQVDRIAMIRFLSHLEVTLRGPRAESKRRQKGDIPSFHPCSQTTCVLPQEPAPRAASVLRPVKVMNSYKKRGRPGVKRESWWNKHLNLWRSS